MRAVKTFYSKKFFLFNLILVSVLIGFTLAFMTFGCSSKFTVGETAYAQEKTGKTTSEKTAASVGSLRNMQNSFNNIAEKVKPAVVTLRVVNVVEQQVPRQGWPWQFLQPEGQRNDEGQGNDGQSQQFKQRGIGSGVIVRQKGNTYYILTNAHVVGKADKIEAVLNSGKEFSTEMVGKDPRRDLALVKFTSSKDLSVAELGNSDKLKVGDWVMAVGSPFGFVNSVTAGIVSAKGRSGPQNTISQFIQTDASINKGNSGGALVNIEGEVVGINTWIAAPTGGSIGLGFAVPINDAKKAVDDIIATGKVDYGWLGVTITDVSEQFAKEMNLETRNGALVHNIYLDSPAEKGGLLTGDFITKVDGEPVESHDELVRVVGNLKAGKKVDFTLIRHGEKKTVTVEIGERKDKEAITSQQTKLWPGMIVVPLQKQAREKLELDSSVSGVLVANLPKKSKAYIGGLRPYDVITEINGKNIESMLDFYKAVNNTSTNEYKIGFIRDGSKFSVGITKE